MKALYVCCSVMYIDHLTDQELFCEIKQLFATREMTLILVERKWYEPDSGMACLYCVYEMDTDASPPTGDLHLKSKVLKYNDDDPPGCMEFSECTPILASDKIRVLKVNDDFLCRIDPYVDNRRLNLVCKSEQYTTLSLDPDFSLDEVTDLTIVRAVGFY